VFRRHIAALAHGADFARPDCGKGAGAMTMSCNDAGTKGVQRFEVFTGAGKRRAWPLEVKASIVAESYSGLETICAVARRHGLAPSQLFTWRRQLRKQFESTGLGLPRDDPERNAQDVRVGHNPIPRAETGIPDRHPRGESACSSPD